MKSILIFTFLSLSVLGVSQITNVKEKKKCYEKYDANGKLIPKSQQRYSEWECGKLAGVVDCNEKLRYDEGTGIMYSGNFGKPFTGTCETCYMNGKIHHRVSFVDGKENGIDTTYYESGCPQVIRNHIRGVENGQWIYYYDSTNYIAWEMNYQLGKKHGKHIFFEADGDTIRWENYKNGLLDGIKRTYYDGSKIKNEISYKDGKFDGHFKVYNPDGVIIQDVNYVDGKKHEEAKYYYDDGTLLRTENWDMGVKNGEFKVFYYQGNLQSTETYKKGQKIGWFIDYYPNSIVKQKILYDKKGNRIEEHRYDEHGRETYAFGTPDDNGAEDDEVPTIKKKKKRKKKDRNKND